MTASDPVIVVGGGWAGLSCAVELTRLGHCVTLLESARQLGGRARRIAFGEHAVDNGQHILLGAYEHTLRLLNLIGVNVEQKLLRLPLQLHLQDLHSNSLHLITPRTPAPLHLLLGLIRARGISLMQRWAAIRFGLRICRNKILTDSDISVAELLKRENQSRKIIQWLWEPLCLAALNTPIDLASAEVFMQVLHSAFCRQQHDSDLILPRVDLSALLPDPAYDYLEQRNGHVELAQRVDKILFHQRRVQGVQCSGTERMATHIVLALPPYAVLPLLKPITALQDLHYNLTGFSYEPICTVYVQYPVGTLTDFPIQGYIGTLCQWVIDRQIYSQPGLMAVVISGPGSHTDMPQAQLAERVIAELTAAFPHWPKPDASYVVCEKRATFSCRPNINAIRPENRTAIQGLWLAGDYTNTGYPATIEGAVQSGLRCSQQIHAETQLIKS